MVDMDMSYESEECRPDYASVPTGKIEGTSEFGQTFYRENKKVSDPTKTLDFGTGHKLSNFETCTAKGNPHHIIIKKRKEQVKVPGKLKRARGQR